VGPSFAENARAPVWLGPNHSLPDELPVEAASATPPLTAGPGKSDRLIPPRAASAGSLRPPGDGRMNDAPGRQA
jgi:hypothetical protein